MSLASNKLTTLANLAPSALIRALPNLENLSLESNQFDDIKMLNPLTTDDKIGRAGLGCLRELVLNGNPMRENAIASGNLQKFTTYVSYADQLHIADFGIE